jgi:hypothetical protein
VTRINRAAAKGATNGVRLTIGLIGVWKNEAPVSMRAGKANDGFEHPKKLDAAGPRGG